MLVLEVKVVHLRFFRGVTTLFTHVHLRPSLFVLVVVFDSVDFYAVAFQRAALCERFLTEITFVGANACVCSCVSL